MDLLTEKLCGCCFTVVNSSNYESIGGGILEILDYSYINLNKNSTEDPIFCSNCVKNITSAADFKCRCLMTEYFVLPYFSSETSKIIDFKMWLWFKTPLNTEQNMHTLEVCRLCKNFVNNTSVVPIYQLLKDNGMVNVFKKYLSEINLKTALNPCICGECYESMVNFRNISYFLTDFFYKTDKMLETCVEDDWKILPSDPDVINEVEETQEMLTSLDWYNINSIVQEIYEIGNSYTTITEEEQITIPSGNEVVDINTALSEDTGLDKSSTEPIQDNSTETQVCTWFKCRLCDFQTTSASDRKAHVKSEHKSISGLYKCKICLYETKHIHRFKDHSLRHQNMSESEMNKCELCSYKSKTLADVKKHMKTHQNPSELKMHTCKICPFQTKYSYYLKRHVKSQHNSGDSELYSCRVCGFEKEFLPHETKFNRCSYCNFKLRLS